jgi:PIN domain nuclease of toxin-antitoxin system
LALLIDTHVLIWIGEDNPRLPQAMRARLCDPDEELFVSAVTAFEYADLQHRGRIPQEAGLAELQDQMGLQMLDCPAYLWTIAAALPPIHRDPIDRMLIAHALALDMALVSADAAICRYPGLRVAWD